VLWISINKVSFFTFFTKFPTILSTVDIFFYKFHRKSAKVSDTFRYILQWIEYGSRGWVAVSL